MVKSSGREIPALSWSSGKTSATGKSEKEAHSWNERRNGVAQESGALYACILS